MSNFLERYAEIVGIEHVETLINQGSYIAQIISARKRKKWSQEDLAKAVGCAKSTIGRIESGVMHPSTKMLEKISRELKIPIIINGMETKESETNVMS